MKYLIYYLLLGILILYFIKYYFTDQENFDPSLVPVSSIVTLANAAQKLASGNGTLNTPGTLTANIINVTGSTTLNGISSGNTNTNTLNVNTNANIGYLNLSTDTLCSSGNLLLNSQSDVQIYNNNLLVDQNLTVTGNLRVNKNLNVSGSDGINTTAKYKEKGNILIPTGTIVAYYNQNYSPGITQLPGWVICDGTNGTPDLRGRFIRMASNGVSSTNSISPASITTPEKKGVGIGSQYQYTKILTHTVGDYAGSDAHIFSTSELPSHTHPVTDPGHTHTYRNLGTGSIEYAGSYAGNASTWYINASSGNSNHTSTGNSVTQNTSSSTTGISVQSINTGDPPVIVPRIIPSYTLIFIMKT